jgi:hypothetical protein
LVEVRGDPSAALESAAAVLVRPAWPLQYSVDGTNVMVISFIVAVRFSMVWLSFG